LDFLSGPSNPYFSVRQIISDFNKSAHLKLTDLGSTCDVTVLKDILNHRRARVLEIGGGYGRLAEALLRNSGAKLQIDMLDVIPSSLALAKSYLSQSGVSVNLLQELSSSNVDVNLHLPSTVESIPDGSVDLAINVESFQEMTQDWVDYWIKIIDKKTRVGSFFYQSNAFQFRNFFELSLDSKWFLEKSIRHPRHWTQGHRTEIWRRIN
jgi:putative sugar O-methyltransferase